MLTGFLMELCLPTHPNPGEHTPCNEVLIKSGIIDMHRNLTCTTATISCCSAIADFGSGSNKTSLALEFFSNSACAAAANPALYICKQGTSAG